MLVDSLLQQAGIFARCLGVVDGAGPDDHQQALVLAAQNVRDLLAGLVNSRRRLFRGWKLFFQKDRRQYDFDPLDAKVVG